MRTITTNDAEALALAALAATLTDERRAERFLALTGLSPDELRRRAAERGLLGATLAFLESHEPDLVAVAGQLGLAPAELVEARRALEP
jgi:hypothetical protein